MPNRTSLVWLYGTVFLTGASVMVIELLGTRLIAPFYGNSLYVWTSVIAVTLFALALGYFLGGRWVDRPRHPMLAQVIAASGLLCMTIPWLAPTVLLATDPLGLRGGALVSTLILFTPSLMALGMVGPFAVKQATQTLSGVGTGAGSIYAINTIGSVVGTLFLGFFLFPLLGAREIFLGVGLLLLMLALGVWRMERQRTTRRGLASLLLFGVAGALALLKQIQDTGVDPAIAQGMVTRFETETLYGRVRVLDDSARNVRLLSVDASVIGAAALDSGANALVYQQVVPLLPALVPNLQKTLLIGQGAGHMAGALASQGVVTDTIEIDPAVAQAAVEWFGFQPTGRTLIGDARYEIRRLAGPYDLIILDVFTGGTEPIHLLTREALQQMQTLLSAQGMITLNFVGFLEGGRNPGLASVARTVSAVFPHWQVFVSDPGDDFNDYIFLASSTPVLWDALAPPLRGWLDERRVEVDPDAGVLLTDNFNPLEKLQNRKSEQYRGFIVDLIGADLLVR